MAIASGQRLTPARLNPIIADLRQTTAQTLPNNTWVALLFQAEDIDTHGGHSTTSNTGRYTCTLAGTYMFNGAVAFASHATGQRWCRWHLNGGEIFGTGANVQAITGQPTLLTARTAVMTLAVGDYVELAAFQSSGGNLDTYISGAAGYAQSGMSVWGVPA